MDLGLKDKCALVMASSSGLGKAIAKEFAREGARVMLFSRSEEALERAQREIFEETGNSPAFFAGSIKSADDIRKLVLETVTTFGPVYALVNNTGGLQPGLSTTLTMPLGKKPMN